VPLSRKAKDGIARTVLSIVLLTSTAARKAGLGQKPFLSHLRHLPMDGLDIGPGCAQEDLMVAVSNETVQETHHQLAPRRRAAVLGPRGGGTTRRRGL